ncbi:MAG: CARDB domain-containing protein, partial [Acidobacteriota bacterium]|jgi:hypothetical protein
MRISRHGVFAVLASVLFVASAPVLLCAQVRGKAVRNALLPDLAVTGLALDAGCGLRITVRNLGPGEVPAAAYRPGGAFALHLMIDGKVCSTVDFAKFDPGRMLQKAGGTVVWTWKSSPKSNLLEGGPHRVAAATNWKNHVKEGGRRGANDRLIKNLTCRQPLQKKGGFKPAGTPPAIQKQGPVSPVKPLDKRFATKPTAEPPPSSPLRIALITPNWSEAENLTVVVRFNLDLRTSSVTAPGAIVIKQWSNGQVGQPLPGRIVLQDMKTIKWSSDVAGWLCSKGLPCHVQITITDLVKDRWGRPLDGDRNGTPGGSYSKVYLVPTGPRGEPPDLRVCLDPHHNVIGGFGGWENDIYFKVRNYSTSDAPASKLMISIQGKETTVQSVPAIPAGHSVYIKRTVTFNRGGRHWVYSATVDPQNQIHESNENNNTVSGDIYTHGTDYSHQHPEEFTLPGLKARITHCS